MTIQFTGRDTRELIMVLEQFNRPRTFLLDRFFPGAVYAPTQFLDIEDIIRGRHMAPIVHEDHRGRDVRSGGFNMSSFEPPLMKPLEAVNPHRALQRAAGEALGGEMDPAQRYEAIKLDMMLEQRKSVTRRMEWYAASALLTGTIAVTGHGYKQPITIDFQRKASLTKALVGAARWGEAGVNPGDDIEDWMAEVQDASGFGADVIIFEKDAWRYAKPFIKDDLDNRRQAGGEMQFGPVNIGDHVSDAKYLGHWGDVEVYLYQETVQDGDSTHKLMPQYSVIVGSKFVEGVRGYAALTSRAHGFIATDFAPRLIGDEMNDRDWVEGQCKGVPIMGRANAVMSAIVR